MILPSKRTRIYFESIPKILRTNSPPIDSSMNIPDLSFNRFATSVVPEFIISSLLIISEIIGVLLWYSLERDAVTISSSNKIGSLCKAMTILSSGSLN